MSRLAAALVFASMLTQATEPVTGPAIGSAAPDFEAKDQDGRTRSLSSMLGPNGALLVFFRSADW
jgi:hypothetical protein